MDALIADSRSLDRAAAALRCLPFRRSFYTAVSEGSLDAETLASVESESLRFLRLSPQQAEDHLLWLIRLGVLRREVDGQGLTRRVRLTPMGREVLERIPAEIPRANVLQRCWGTWRRHRPRRL